MTYRLPKKTVKPEDLTKARADGFLSGYIVCLTNITHGGRSVDNLAIAAWDYIGKPDAKTVAKLGLSDIDRQTCKIFRSEQKIRGK